MSYYYQLCAIGKTAMYGKPNKIYSIKIFPSIDLAEEHRDKFIKEVTTAAYPLDESYLSQDGLEVIIGGLRVSELHLGPN